MATLSALSTNSGEELHLITRVRRFYRYRRAILALLSELNEMIVSEHATGTLLVHYSQGSVAVCEFRQQVDPKDLSQ